MDRLWTNLIVVSNASDAVLNYCGPLDIYIYNWCFFKERQLRHYHHYRCLFLLWEGSLRNKGGGDAVAGIGILRNITVSRTTILLTYLSSAVRCHVTDRVKLCYTWECWYFECHCVGSNCTIYVSLYLILIFFNLLKSFTG